MPAATETFETQLAKEMVKSERQRITVVALVGAIAATYILVQTLVFPELIGMTIAEQERSLAFVWIQLPFVALVVYALALRGRLSRTIESGRAVSDRYRYGTVAFEITFVTAVILVFGPTFDPIQILISPLVVLYGAFICSATLQMDFKSPLFAAVLSVVGYLGSFAWALGTIDASAYPPWLIAPNPYVGRSIVLFVIGVVCSFVASQIRKRVVSVMTLAEERNRITRTFGQHVSPQVVDRLLQQEAKPVNEMRHVCVMFLDIRSFTAWSEGKAPEQVVGMLNGLFTFMIDVINRHEGFINKFLGDGFMAVFGAPISTGEHCANAVHASTEILERLVDHNRQTEQDIGIGIGLHTGEALTGSVGSMERTEYTVIGDVVNVASRVESLNKQFGAKVLITSDVRDKLPEDMRELEDLGPVKVKGRAQEVHVFRVA